MSDEIATYSFLPWLRQGIANDIDATGSTRASLSVTLKVETDTGLTEEVKTTVQLVGPGDIVGISSSQIIRTEPRDWITNFEPNFFPFIEFYNEDFLWSYTPARLSGDKLAPWLALVVLREDEFSDYYPSGAPLTAIQVDNADVKFPPRHQLWAWAHVHVNENIAADDPADMEAALANLLATLEANPDLAYCRLICPRKLDENTAYHAFLIPAFETGRQAGLGQEVAASSATDPAWGNGQIDFPVYYRWFFRTGGQGDFEYLVRLLEPKPMDSRVGIRDMDVTDPGWGMPGISDPPTLGLKGALKSPDTRSTEWPSPYPSTFQTQLRELINKAHTYLEDGSPDGGPSVVPPIYGNLHVLVDQLEDKADEVDLNWLDDLNLDPRHRTAAGFGAQVVRKNQEKHMNEAWQQLGDILEANQQIGFSRLAMETSLRLYEKHITPLDTDAAITVTHPVSKKVLGSPRTVYSLIQSSALPQALLDRAFRKITRPRGPLIKRIDPTGDRKPAGLLSRVNAGELTATPPKTAPEGAISVDQAADALGTTHPPGWLRDLLAEPWFRWLPIFVLVVLLIVLRGLVLGVVAIGLMALFMLFRGWHTQAEASEIVREENLTVESVEAIPGRPDFTIVEPGTPSGPGGVGTDSPEAANFRQALTDLHELFEFGSSIVPPVPGPLDLPAIRTTLVGALDPLKTIPTRTLSRLGLTDAVRQSLQESFVPVMAYPVFKDPMYEALRDISIELMIPNLSLIEPNAISLLESNPRFIEAYMVGLNHEMNRELVWREYYCDQRGSSFRQFWDVSEVVVDASLSEAEREELLRDIPEIHTWSQSTRLGEHPHPATDEAKEQLVLVIRGDLLKKYPNTVLYAQKAAWATDEDGNPMKLLPRELDTAAEELLPIFKATIDPDIVLFGFDLTEEEAKGDGQSGDDPGYFFVLKERPGEPRYGLDYNDDPGLPALKTWDDLSWDHVTIVGDGFVDAETLADTPTDPAGVAWGASAADMAHILYQDPVLIAIHASQMLT
jgi:hypothetical protein